MYPVRHVVCTQVNSVLIGSKIWISYVSLSWANSEVRWRCIYLSLVLILLYWSNREHKHFLWSLPPVNTNSTRTFPKIHHKTVYYSLWLRVNSLSVGGSAVDWLNFLLVLITQFTNTVRQMGSFPNSLLVLSQSVFCTCTKGNDIRTCTRENFLLYFWLKYLNTAMHLVFGA